MNVQSLLNDKIPSLFIKYSIPTVLSMVTYSLYVLADTIFVGIGAGADALAAFNLAVPMFTLYSAIGLMLGVGGSTTMAILSGSNDKSNNSAIFTYMSLISLIIGIIISIMGNINLEILSRMLGADDNLLPLTKQYLRPINGLAFINIYSTTLQIFIRNDGNAKIVMFATIISNILNIVGDFILIFVFKMGIVGAAIPTAIAPLIAILIMLLHFGKKTNNLNIKFKINDNKYIFRSIKNGMGSFLMEITNGMSTFIFNILILKFAGTIGVAVYAIVANIAYMFKFIFVGISQAIQPILSTNYGANQMERVRKTLSFGIKVSIIIGIIFYAILFLFAKEIVSIFINENDNTIISMAITAVRIYFISLPLSCLNILMSYYYQSIEQPKLSSFISFMRSLVFIILGAIVLTYIFGINGIWNIVTFSELSTLLIIIFMIKFKKINVYNKLS